MGEETPAASMTPAVRRNGPIEAVLDADGRRAGKPRADGKCRAQRDTISRRPSATKTAPATRSSHSPARGLRCSHWPIAPAK